MVKLRSQCFVITFHNRYLREHRVSLNFHNSSYFTLLTFFVVGVLIFFDEVKAFDSFHFISDVY